MRPKILTFSGFNEEGTDLNFRYDIDGREVVIHSRLTKEPTLEKIHRSVVIKNIGMAFLLDIAEVILPEKIIIKIPLLEQQIQFWKQAFWNVGRERQYVTRQPLSKLHIDWELKNKQTVSELFRLHNVEDAAILCTTGGKESLSALKLLKEHKNLLLFTLDPHTNIHRKKAMSFLQTSYPLVSIISNRRETLYSLEHTYSGKWSSGFDMGLLIFHALLYSDTFPFVLIGNEYSSNFPNTYYEGFPVNHQYVKTLHLAKSINEYIQSFVTPDFSYTSPFFGLYEYKIAEYFFANDTYMEVWTSCNLATETKNFCENCPKCAFSYLMGLVYRDLSFLQRYFTVDMLNERFELFRELMDFTSMKPLECVGEKKEVWVAMAKIYEQKKDTNSSTMQYFLKNIYPLIQDEIPSFEKEISTIQKSYPPLPEFLDAIVKKAFG